MSEVNLISCYRGNHFLETELWRRSGQEDAQGCQVWASAERKWCWISWTPTAKAESVEQNSQAAPSLWWRLLGPYKAWMRAVSRETSFHLYTKKLKLSINHRLRTELFKLRIKVLVRLMHKTDLVMVMNWWHHSDIIRVIFWRCFHTLLQKY